LDEFHDKDVTQRDYF